MKIGVFGDSFADRWHHPEDIDESWMQYLEDHGHYVESYGLGATSTWFSFERFLGLYEYFDAVVFAYSHHTRMHVLPEKYAPISSHHDKIDQVYHTYTYQNANDEEREEIITLLKAADISKNLVFNWFVQHKIFEEVNRICRQHNIKLVNLMPFADKETLLGYNLKESHGDCLYNLVPVVMKELDLCQLDPRQCHLSLENNQILGKVILDSINNNQLVRIVNLDKEVNFVYDEAITARYQNLINLKQRTE